MENCLNCNTEIKSGLLSNVTAFSERKVKVINEYNEPKPGYCTKCGKGLYETSVEKLKGEIEQLILKIKNTLDSIIIVTTNNPLGWEYTIRGMVTAQSVTGTGVISEFASSFTDFFGAQSNRYNTKIKLGEDLCKIQLRKQALELGGNAIIATDIDYAEVGGDKGMLMVCMSGTVITISNTNIISQKYKDSIEELNSNNNRLNYLSSLLEY